ncbi:unnamed protein product [Tuber aestivum]|uniref:Uncharacterized protein n=1 Tax=Tuber aestivum TaxID=59557 RepID=A0A292PIT9_9PEZI|nr:unnamed protein product [Tuber aestivum]
MARGGQYSWSLKRSWVDSSSLLEFPRDIRELVGSSLGITEPADIFNSDLPEDMLVPHRGVSGENPVPLDFAVGMCPEELKERLEERMEWVRRKWVRFKPPTPTTLLTDQNRTKTEYKPPSIALAPKTISATQPPQTPQFQQKQVIGLSQPAPLLQVAHPVVPGARTAGPPKRWSPTKSAKAQDSRQRNVIIPCDDSGLTQNLSLFFLVEYQLNIRIKYMSLRLAELSENFLERIPQPQGLPRTGPEGPDL